MAGGARDAAVAVSPLIMGSHTFASRLYLHSAACRHIAGASSSHTGARTDRSTIKRKKGDQRAWKGDFGLGSSKAIKFKNHPAKVYKYMINFFLISHAKSSVYTAKTGCAVDRGQNEYVFPCKEQRARWPRSSIKICCADEKKKEIRRARSWEYWDGVLVYLPLIPLRKVGSAASRSNTPAYTSKQRTWRIDFFQQWR